MIPEFFEWTYRVHSFHRSHADQWVLEMGFLEESYFFPFIAYPCHQPHQLDLVAKNVNF